VVTDDDAAAPAGSRSQGTQVMVLTDSGDAEEHSFNAEGGLGGQLNSCNKADVRINVSLSEPLVSQSPERPGFYDCSINGSYHILEEERLVETQVVDLKRDSALATQEQCSCMAAVCEDGSHSCVCTGATLDIPSSSPVLRASNRKKPTEASQQYQFTNDVFLEDLESSEVKVLDDLQISYPSKNPFLPLSMPVLIENGQITPETCQLFASHTFLSNASEEKLRGQVIELHQIPAELASVGNGPAAPLARLVSCADAHKMSSQSSESRQPNGFSMNNSIRAKAAFSTDLPVNPALRPRQYSQSDVSTPVYHITLKAGGANERDRQMMDDASDKKCAQSNIGTSTGQDVQEARLLINSKHQTTAETSFIENVSRSQNNSITKESRSETQADAKCASSCVSGSGIKSTKKSSISYGGSCQNISSDCDTGSKFTSGASESACNAGSGHVDSVESQEVGEPFLLVLGGQTEECGSVHPKPLALWKGVLF
jgi:hypothetical protein